MYVSIACDVLFNLCAALLGVGPDNINVSCMPCYVTRVLSNY